MNATPANARLGKIASSRWASVSTIVGSDVEPEIRLAVNSTISSAGSARKPTNISRRAPIEPNAVPMSIAASAMKTRASANSPTSAIASAARANGRSVASDGTIAAAQHIAPKTM